MSDDPNYEPAPNIEKVARGLVIIGASLIVFGLVACALLIGRHC